MVEEQWPKLFAQLDATQRDECDARVLSRMENTDTTVPAVQFGNREVDVPRTFDGEHLRAIHGHPGLISAPGGVGCSQ